MQHPHRALHLFRVCSPKSPVPGNLIAIGLVSTMLTRLYHFYKTKSLASKPWPTRARCCSLVERASCLRWTQSPGAESRGGTSSSQQPRELPAHTAPTHVLSQGTETAAAVPETPSFSCPLPGQWGEAPRAQSCLHTDQEVAPVTPLVLSPRHSQNPSSLGTEQRPSTRSPHPCSLAQWAPTEDTVFLIVA